ncbi:MAG: OmpA family protein, partial [Cytophagales bacterium]|nr:OmpA family protein [Cytophagales bacterium]
NPGDISAPVNTPYGWHIIKLIERKNLGSFDELKGALKTKVSRDQRSEMNRYYLIERLKTEDKLVEKPKALKAAFAKIDSNAIKNKWSDAGLNQKDKEAILFTIGNDKYTAEGYFKFAKEKQNFKNVTSADFLARLLYKDYVENALVAYEEAHLSEKYSDYRLLLKEYRDGILLFQLMDKKVWSKAVEDTAGLRKYHAENNGNYRWKTRTIATVYNCSNKDVLTKVKTLLAQKKFEVASPKLEDILFEKGSAKLKEEFTKKLDATASALRTGKELTIELFGFGDISESKNSGLVKERLEAVRKYLIGKNVDSTKITTTNKGFIKPASKTSDISKNLKVSAVICSTSNKELEKLVNATEALSLQITDGKFQPGENEIVGSLEQKPGVYETEKGGRSYYVIIKSIEEPRNKTLDECRGLVISDYQGYLEKQWIAELKKTYPVTVNEEEVKKLITK